MIFFGMKKDLSFFIILGFLMSSLTFFLSMRNYSMFDGIYKKNFSNKILFLIVIFIINIIFSGVLGDLIAQNHIESNNIITFDWKGDPPKELEGKDLVLIDIREGNYFVVERQKPANEQPEVYLIPKDQIEFAILKNLK
ncbi:MAG: hypothetical protein MUP85_23475 [Candidatus Lokiarchaeota archaeon]|nr:hypothetical protein [Candidatus Lokiarchaeota archaeon]